MSATLLPHVEGTTRPPTTIGAGPYVVASDGSEGADGALRIAELLAERYGGTSEIVTVVEPIPIVTPEVQLPMTPELEEARRAERMGAVHAQIARVTGDARTLPVKYRAGAPPAEIVEEILDSSAKLVVVGLGRHGVIDRLFGDETALQLLRMSPVPVLAVPARADHLPRSAVVAMDFSPSAIRAARLALELLGAGATLHLVHVASRDIESAVWEQLQAEYTKTVRSSFEQVMQQLAASPSISVETITLRGDPAHALLQFASRVGADLIAAGSHGHGFFSRMLLGSVATKLLRGSTCMVLGVPLAASEAAEEDGLRSGERASENVPRRKWAEVLDGFTRRNIGRRASLEVDDADFGAQAQEHDYPLLGVSYDHHDGRVEIMLGDLGSTARHLTRSIADVTSVDLLRDGKQRDVALRFQHGAGQTLLTLSR